MGIFRRDEDTGPIREAPAPATIKERQEIDEPELTHVAAGTEIEGSLTGTSGVCIHGRFKGDIEVSKRVEILEHGYLEGKIEAREVMVKGTVLGSIKCAERLEIAATGRVEGEISAPRLVMVDGGFLKGSTHMEAEAARPEKKPAARPATQPQTIDGDQA